MTLQIEIRTRIAEYLEDVSALRLAIENLSPDQLRARPISGKWSTLETVCHIVDCDSVLSDRMKRVIAENNPPLLSFDENLWMNRLACNDRDPFEELHLLSANRRQLATVLATLKPDDFNRSGRHDVDGAITLNEIFEKAIAHLRHHLKFILEKRGALLIENNVQGLPVGSKLISAFDVSAIEIVPGFTRQTLATGDDVMLCLFKWKKGAELPMHHHPHEQVGYVIEGETEMTVAGELLRMKAGDSYVARGNEPHGGIAIEDSIVLDAFSPPRSDYRRYR